jgi:anhydro-N-acetylmuramic acid kinase
VDAAFLRRLLADPYFRKPYPKTAGREEFGREFVEKIIADGPRGPSGLIATATALTVETIADAVRGLAQANPGANYREVVASGGGTRNATMMRGLANALVPMGIRLRHSDEFGMPSEAKEAVAFALLAYQTWHRRPSNIPSATGAKRPAILGQVSYV